MVGGVRKCHGKVSFPGILESVNSSLDRQPDFKIGGHTTPGFR